jgi:hypothetical protein
MRVFPGLPSIRVSGRSQDETSYSPHAGRLEADSAHLLPHEGRALELGQAPAGDRRLVEM